MNKMLTKTLFAVALAIAANAPTPVMGQVATEELARRLVGEGIEAAKSRDWVTARERFQRAYEIQPLPLTLYNLAAAQEKTGQFVEADRAYRIFLRETSEGDNEEFRKAASKRRAALRKRIAFVVVRASGIAPDDVLLIGDLQIAQAVLGESIPTNPGDLTIRVMRSGAAVASQSVRLGRGESKVVTLEVPPQAALPAVTSAPPPPASTSAAPPVTATAAPAEEAKGGVLRSPVFWGILTAVVLAGAGAGVYFGTRTEDPFASSIDGVSIVGR